MWLILADDRDRRPLSTDCRRSRSRLRKKAPHRVTLVNVRKRSREPIQNHCGRQSARATDAKQGGTRMILRKWSGRIRATDREEYVAYVLETGASDYSKTPGNHGFQLLTRDVGDGTTEVSTMSWW